MKRVMAILFAIVAAAALMQAASCLWHFQFGRHCWNGWVRILCERFRHQKWGR